MAQFICIKFYHRANTCSKYADGFYDSRIDDKNSHIPSPLSRFTCTVVCHTLLEWQKNKDVHPKVSKAKVKAVRSHRSIYFNYKIDGGQNASCGTATDHKLLLSPGFADTYTVLMNTWNTLPES